MDKRFIIWIGVIAAMPLLACSAFSRVQVTPTPTKTPRLVEAVPTTVFSTPTSVVIPPTDTPVSVEQPVEQAPAQEEVAPAEEPVEQAAPTEEPTVTPIPTDTPPPPPTNTPLPPPPPTNTPAPPTATFTPAPPTNTPPPPSRGPDVVVQLPDGDTHEGGDDIRIIIIVSDPDGVKSFTWGIFSENRTPLTGGDENCGGRTECRIEETISVPDTISGQFAVGVEAVDNAGDGTQINAAQLYIG